MTDDTGLIGGKDRTALPHFRQVSSFTFRASLAWPAAAPLGGVLSP